MSKSTVVTYLFDLWNGLGLSNGSIEGTQDHVGKTFIRGDVPWTHLINRQIQLEECVLRWSGETKTQIETILREMKLLVGTMTEISRWPFETFFHGQDRCACVGNHAHVVLTGVLYEESKCILHHELHSFDKLLQFRNGVNMKIGFIDVVPKRRHSWHSWTMLDPTNQPRPTSMNFVLMPWRRLFFQVSVRYMCV